MKILINPCKIINSESKINYHFSTDTFNVKNFQNHNEKENSINYSNTHNSLLYLFSNKMHINSAQILFSKRF